MLQENFHLQGFQFQGMLFKSLCLKQAVPGIRCNFRNNGLKNAAVLFQKGVGQGFQAFFIPQIYIPVDNQEPCQIEDFGFHILFKEL